MGEDRHLAEDPQRTATSPPLARCWVEVDHIDLRRDHNSQTLGFTNRSTPSCMCWVSNHTNGRQRALGQKVGRSARGARGIDVTLIAVVVSPSESFDLDDHPTGCGHEPSSLGLGQQRDGTEPERDTSQLLVGLGGHPVTACAEVEHHESVGIDDGPSSGRPSTDGTTNEMGQPP
jgi:hypothetical protein